LDTCTGRQWSIQDIEEEAHQIGLRRVCAAVGRNGRQIGDVVQRGEAASQGGAMILDVSIESSTVASRKRRGQAEHHATTNPCRPARPTATETGVLLDLAENDDVMWTGKEK
jgi:hypothetical protein